MISFTSMRDVSGCVWRTGWRGREWKQKAQSQALQQGEPEVVVAGLWEEAEIGDEESRQVAGLGPKFERRMGETCPLCPLPSDPPGLGLYVPAVPPSTPVDFSSFLAFLCILLHSSQEVACSWFTLGAS